MTFTKVLSTFDNLRPVEDTDHLLHLLEVVESENFLEARAACIQDALRDPFIDKSTACELLDELAAIEIELQKG